MLKYAKITDEQTGLCEVGLGTNSSFYQSIGMTEQDVCQSSVDGNWYLSEKCPQKTDEEILSELKTKNKKKIQGLQNLPLKTDTLFLKVPSLRQTRKQSETLPQQCF